MTLVYSGNMSPTKNFDLCLRVVSTLQAQLKQRVNFACYGTFNSSQAKDDVYPNTVLLPGLVESYEDYVRILVSKLPWTTPPSFNGYVHPEKWLQDEMASPAYFNLSCYEMEDFGVSAAQAQAAGWPCLLSDWGGFQDVRGSNIAESHPAWKLGEGFQIDGRRICLANFPRDQRRDWIWPGDPARDRARIRGGSRLGPRLFPP